MTNPSSIDLKDATRGDGIKRIRGSCQEADIEVSQTFIQRPPCGAGVEAGVDAVSGSRRVEGAAIRSKGDGGYG